MQNSHITGRNQTLQNLIILIWESNSCRRCKSSDYLTTRPPRSDLLMNILLSDIHSSYKIFITSNSVDANKKQFSPFLRNDKIDLRAFRSNVSLLSAVIHTFHHQREVIVRYLRWRVSRRGGEERKEDKRRK